MIVGLSPGRNRTASTSSKSPHQDLTFLSNTGRVTNHVQAARLTLRIKRYELNEYRYTKPPSLTYPIMIRSATGTEVTEVYASA